MTTTTQNNVPQTIAKQLGRALFMLGACNLIADKNALTFKIRGCKTVTHIRIELDPCDTYSMTFSKVRGFEVTTVRELEGVYNDGLCQAIESVTGLATSL